MKIYGSGSTEAPITPEASLNNYPILDFTIKTNDTAKSSALALQIYDANTNVSKWFAYKWVSHLVGFVGRLAGSASAARRPAGRQGAQRLV